MVKRIVKNWRNPNAAGGLQGPKRYAGNNNVKLTNVISYLRGRDGYTLHKQPRRKFPRRKIVATTINSQWVGDLLDLQKLSKDNDGVKYILFYIDVVSRKLYGEPLIDKSGASVLKATKAIFDRVRVKPRRIQFDKGTEINNKLNNKFLKDLKIKLFFTEDDAIKGSLVERSNRNMKRVIHAYLTEYNTRRYIDVLQQFIQSYNNSFHKNIGMKPNEVNKSNVIDAIYHNISIPPKRTVKFKKGDYVRLLGTKKVFDRGYDILWSEQIFIVKHILKTTPTTYTVEDLSGESIKGSFYQQELQLVKYPEEFLVEKVFKHRVRMKNKKPIREVLVRWLGYPEKFDEWVQENSVTKTK